MSVILYKKGNAGKVRGIPCQIQICNEFSYKHLLEQEWFYTPEECYAKEEQEEPVRVVVWTPNPDFGPPKLSDEEIRASAKDAGISSWHMKSIDRLEKELKDLEHGEQSED